jgi:isopentenyl phosphate kinase
MLVFVKLGGSLITDKQVENSFRELVVKQLAEEVRTALNINPDLKILLGHGSGSFGHFAASHHRTADSVSTSEEWRAFAHVANTAAELNYFVTRAFETTGVPIWRIQPSASASCRDAMIMNLEHAPINAALTHNLVPLVYGDVALDSVRGGTIISTEKIFFHLAQHFPVDQIFLLGEVEGVLDGNHDLIPEITPQLYPGIKSALSGSAGVDVTGGMETKVSDMLALVKIKPGLSIRIFDGSQHGLLEQTLLGKSTPGTSIRADSF